MLPPPRLQRVPGVVATCAGYAQGHVERPTYEQVGPARGNRLCRRPAARVCAMCSLGKGAAPGCARCTSACSSADNGAAPTVPPVPCRPRPQVCGGRTGHTEAVQLTYRPGEVSFDQLCDVFLKKIDPKQVPAVPAVALGLHRAVCLAI